MRVGVKWFRLCLALSNLARRAITQKDQVPKVNL